LHPIGYKILLEILIRGQWSHLVEVPYHFHARAHGKSKADLWQGILALQHMWQLLKEVPVAGRVWKVMGLVIVNIFVILTILTLFTNVHGTWDTLKNFLFVIIGLTNFAVLSRLFPREHAAGDNQLSSYEAIESQPTNLIPTPLSIYEPQLEVYDQVTKQKLDNADIEISEFPALIAHDSTPEALIQLKGASSKKRVLTLLSWLIIAVAIGWIIYTLPGAWIILAAFFIGLSVLAHNNTDKHQAITMILGTSVGLSVVDYLTWRFEVTNWAGWWIAIPLLAAETLGAIHTLGFQYTLWPKRQPQYRMSEDPSQHPIYIFIPTVNEGPSILEPTLRGVMEARERYLAKYSHGQVSIVICNDGLVAGSSNWQETEELAKGLGVQCITRTVGGGAKAGNIEYARQQLQATGDALLVIFDADQIAKPDFLLKTVPPFGDSTVGWVQTGQYYHNLDNPVARWADDQQAMFYNLLCPGKAAMNAAFICGTNVVIRASALDQIGGLPQDSVTEDFSASIELHPHWRSLFLTDVLATGLGPMDMLSYLKQQRRWAIGTLSVMRSHWRAILLPKQGGLSVAQRIQYFLACTHYLCGLRDLIYLLSPILFILFGIPAVKGSTLQAFLWHFLPYFLASTAALWYAGRGVTGLRGIIIGFGCFPVLLESLLSVIFKRKIGFTVTSKQRGSASSWKYIQIHVAFVIVSLACVIVATRVQGRQQFSMFISVLWIIYSLCMLGSFLWLNLKDTQFQGSQKQSTQKEVTTSFHYPSRLQNRERGLRPLWNLAFAFCLACIIFLGSGIRLQAAPPARFVISQFGTNRPYLGVALPLSLLKSRPAILEQRLGAHFGIVGRTQDVHDLFDYTWADQLARQNERPWITLEFGVFTAAGRPPVDASLTAVINGVHDQELKRWAQDIRDYGRPVYISILLHVDRNWSLTSAVANGGIPQDSSNAWLHIESVFNEVGATNVAWVWSPADPSHDAQYAPPEATINCVLLSLISYPGTQWVDPRAALLNVIARHPSKPIILEVSADGPSRQKAAWLNKVGEAVLTISGIHALIYHEGSPAINATRLENNQWSLLSDEGSLMAMRQIASSFMQTSR
jgi:cellulose synthase/poly-beta-1,6-N-acetylglucosamine synthase-like glycosyltransferase